MYVCTFTGFLQMQCVAMQHDASRVDITPVVRNELGKAKMLSALQ